MKKCALKMAAVSLLMLNGAAAVSAQSINNPSFEADTFNNFPGYVSGNGPITGWTAIDPARAGINPGGGSPFADNGTIPNGSQVAFIQNSATSGLSNVISGLTAGTTYKVSFRVNARNGNQARLKVDIDGVNLISTQVTPVGGANPYKYFAFDFTATQAEHILTLRNDAGGDQTVLIDDFSVAVRNSGWSYEAWTDDSTAGIDNTKVYTHAFNFGTPAGTTINGVSFTGVPGGNPSGTTFSVAGMPNVFNNDGNNLLATGSRALANDFIYGGFPGSITINGLIPGAEYVATIYSVGWESDTRAATFSVGNDRLTVNQDQFADNNGIRFIYRYIASASSITLTFAPLQNDSIHVYGFSNYELAAPPAPPAIVTHPKSRCVSEGQPFTLTGAASGSPAPTYFWLKNGVEAGVAGSSLSIASATPSDAASYSLVASNSGGMATSSVAVVKVGLPLVNPSFEADSFAAFPGYVSGNGPITGWSAAGGHGINPGTSFSPFADNGVIPDGAKVAFMQQDASLSQMVSGFTPGNQYYVVYFENARSGGIPAIEVKIGDTTIVPIHSRAPVGGANAYVEVTSDVFVAESASMQLSFIKSNPNGGDTTALIDNVCVLEMPAGTAPTVQRNPQSQIASVGQTANFSAMGFGSLPFTFQWRKDGTNITDATNATLTLNNVQKASEAGYDVVIANTSGSVTSAVASLVIWEPIDTLFNTGVNAARAPLADGSIDPHYTLLSNPDTGSPDALVQDSTAFPIVAGPWLANSSSSKWIGPRINTSPSAVGFYTNRTTFNLTNRDPSTAIIIGRWASDNSGRAILVNGVVATNAQSTTFAAYTTFVISTTNATFLPGENTIDFVVENEAAPGYTGLRVEFVASNARILPNIAPSILADPSSQTNVIEGDSVSFSVLATGSDPLQYQWSKDGNDLSGQTNVTLTILNASTNDNGAYAVRVSNGSGFADSQPAQLVVRYRRVPGIYSTGVEDNGTLAVDGNEDLHWIVGSSPDTNSPGPIAYVINAAASPVGPWLSAGPKSKWIAPQPNQNAGNADGNYTYQTFFDLTGVDLCTFRLSGQLLVDNGLTDILVNGIPQGVSGGSFTSWLPFTLTNGFVSGLNTIDFLVNNAAPNPNPTGLRVDLDGLVRIRSIVAPTLTIVQTAPDTLQISWTPTGDCDRLQAATDITGPWTTIGTFSPATVYTTNAPASFFRVIP